jgi:imidazole glycerol-phosphate synthase subunit HisH
MSEYKKIKVDIVNLGFNNTFSIFQAFKSLGCKVQLIDKINKNKTDLLVLPGVGSYAKGMNTLKEKSFDSFIQDYASDNNNKILGVCLGMQLFFSESCEFGKTNGLNLISGKVKKIPNKANKVPHIGWNTVKTNKNNDFFKNNDKHFYFVHSYYCEPKNKKLILSETNLEKLNFCSSVMKDNLIGVQFHPEKSSIAGKNLLTNILKNFI